MELIQKLINNLSKEQVFFRIKNYVFLYYGLIIGIAMFFGYFFVSTSLQVFQIDSKLLFWWIIISIPCTVFCSRIFTPLLAFGEFMENPKEVMKKEWFSFFGGFIGLWFSSLAVVLYYNVPILQFSDALMLFLPPMHFVGRIACINHGCCSVKPKEGDNGIYFSYSGNFSRAVNHYRMKDIKICPVHLYEMSLNFLLGCLLFLLLAITKEQGWVSVAYLFGYGLIRLIIEPYRSEEKKILFNKYSLYQLVLTLTFFGFGFFYIFLMNKSDLTTSIVFKPEYIYYSIKLLPVIFLMSFLAALEFGLRKINHNEKT